MRQALVFVGIGALVILAGLWVIHRNPSLQENKIHIKQSDTIEHMADSFTLTSSAFSHNTSIPPKYTCDAEDMSPPLLWGGVPEGTQSFVLIMDDPDAPGRTWDHWVVFNIPANVRAVLEGKEPEGVAGKNSWGRTGWGGPCPPSGTHHYVFTLFALDTVLGLSEGATKESVESAMKGHVLAETVLTGLYQRQ